MANNAFIYTDAVAARTVIPCDRSRRRTAKREKETKVRHVRSNKAPMFGTSCPSFPVSGWRGKKEEEYGPEHRCLVF